MDIGVPALVPDRSAQPAWPAPGRATRRSVDPGRLLALPQIHSLPADALAGLRQAARAGRPVHILQSGQLPALTLLQDGRRHCLTGALRNALLGLGLDALAAAVAQAPDARNEVRRPQTSPGPQLQGLRDSGRA